MVNQIKILISESESLIITVPEELTYEQLIAFNEKMNSVKSMIESIKESPGSLILHSTTTVKVGKKVGRPKGVKNHKKVGRPKGVKNHKKVGRPKGSKSKTRNGVTILSSTVEPDTAVSHDEKYDRETIRAILSAHYKKDVSKRDELMVAAGINKSTLYVMKNYWMKKFNFTTTELGLTEEN